MKKNLKVMSLVFLGLAVIISITMMTFPSKSYATEIPGHWIYNSLGQHKGCESPGTDCTWNDGQSLS